MRITGTIKPILQPGQVDFDPVRGTTVTEEWHSAGDNLAGIARQYIKDKVAFTWKRSPIKSTIKATYSGGTNGLPDAPQENWQLLANEIQKSIFESPLALDGEIAFPGVLRLVKQAFQLLENGDLEAETDLEADLPDAEYDTYFNPLLTLMLRGSTHFAVGQPVLRHTFSVSNSYDGFLPDIGVSEVIMNLGQIGVGNELINNLAGQIAPGTTHTGYAWGWRRLPSNAVTAANNRVEISREWWWGEWSTNLYPLA